MLGLLASCTTRNSLKTYETRLSAPILQFPAARSKFSTYYILAK